MNLTNHSFKGNGDGWFLCKFCGKETDAPEIYKNDSCPKIFKAERRSKKQRK